MTNPYQPQLELEQPFMTKWLTETLNYLVINKKKPKYFVNHYEYVGTNKKGQKQYNKYRVPMYFGMDEQNYFDFIPNRLYHLVKDWFRQIAKKDEKERNENENFALTQGNLVYYCNVYLQIARENQQALIMKKYWEDADVDEAIANLEPTIQEVFNDPELDRLIEDFEYFSKIKKFIE